MKKLKPKDLRDLAAAADAEIKHHLRGPDAPRPLETDLFLRGEAISGQALSFVEMYDLAAIARTCADHMEESGVDDAWGYGPFSVSGYASSGWTKATIPKGTTVYSTHPRVPGTGLVSKARCTVTVRCIDHGFVLHDKVYPAKLRWAGSGGYWRWCELSAVIAE